MKMYLRQWENFSKFDDLSFFKALSDLENNWDTFFKEAFLLKAQMTSQHFEFTTLELNLTEMTDVKA